MRRLLILLVLFSLVLSGKKIVIRRTPIEGVPLEEAKVKKPAEKDKVFSERSIEILEVSEPEKIEEGFIEKREIQSDVGTEVSEISEPRKIKEGIVIKTRAGEGPDLVPYTPDGWSAPIVCSTVPGDTTADDTLAINVYTRVSLAVANVGDEQSHELDLAIFVGEDMVWHLNDAFIDLDPDSYLVFNGKFTVTSTGTHTVTYKVDYGNYVAEINEENNEFSVDYYWDSGPDLVPYKPKGWSSPCVCSRVPGDTTSAPGDTLFTGIKTYASFAVANVGNETSHVLDLGMFVDGDNFVPLLQGAILDLEPGSYYAFYSRTFTVDASGTHTVTYEVDYGNYVNEINEGNNSGDTTYYYWKHAPNLRPYVPEGWDGAIVASAVPGTHTHDLPPIFGNSTTYIDWAVINGGTLDIPFTDTFYTYLYSDSVPLQGWYTAGLGVDSFVSVEDWEYTFSPGMHTLTIFMDSLGQINESKKSDNRYSCDFFWNEPDWGGGGTWYSDSAEYIIITCDSLAGAFEPLARWKTRKGVYAKIFTVEDICANFSGDHTGDNASRIRNFIYEARESGAIYILLGGQCDFENGEEIVPRRDAYIFSTSDNPYTDIDTIPCDLYYSDLNRNWDMDFDSTYGERNDRVDMYSDIFVGRAPVKNTQQVNNFISKVMTYEKNPDSNYIKKIYLPQGNLWERNHGECINDTIADKIPAGWQISKQYEDIQGIDSIVVNDSINSGFNLQHWVGHGSPRGVYYGCVPRPCTGPYYHSTHPPNNTNDSTKTSIISSMTCLAGAVDKEDNGQYNYDCLAERIVNVNKHAGVATIMNTRYGWGQDRPGVVGPSGRMSVVFYWKLFNTSAYHLGEVISAAKDERAASALTGNRYTRWVLYTWTLFGDPEMPIWIGIPVEMEVSYDRFILPERTTMAINVKEKNTSVPVWNAYVCLWKENEVYKRGYTNESGNLSLEVTPTTPGLMSITVTKENMLPYEGEIIVQNAPKLVVEDVSVSQSSSQEWHDIELGNILGFQNPIVVMGPLSCYDAAPTTMRVKDVTSAEFKFQLDEWDYLDGGHSSEEIPYVVMEEGVYRIDGGIWEAGSIPAVSNSWQTVNLKYDGFDGDQIILTQVVTYNDPAAVVTRVKNVTATSFKIRLQEEEQPDDAGPDGYHESPEAVHYIAIQQGEGVINGRKYKVSKTGNNVTHNWYNLNLADNPSGYAWPVFVAGMQTFNEYDPCALRQIPLTDISVKIKVEEEQAGDSEVSHAAENVGYLVMWAAAGGTASTFTTEEFEEVFENYIKLPASIISGNLILNVSSNYDRKASVELIDIAGRIVKRRDCNLKRGREDLNLGQFGSGIYFLRIFSDEDNDPEVHKITVLR